MSADEKDEKDEKDGKAKGAESRPPDGTPGAGMKRVQRRRAFDPYDSSRTLEGERAIEVFRRRRSPEEANLPPEREKRQKLEIEDENRADLEGEDPGFDPYDTTVRRRGPRRQRRP